MRNWLKFSALKIAILLAPMAPLLQAGINPASITVDVSPPSPIDPSQNLSVSVTVSGAFGLGTGSVKLYIDNAGYGSYVTLSAGSAGFNIPDPANGIPNSVLQSPGNHTISVAYSGDTNYAPQGPNSSDTVTITVKPASTTTVTASANPAVFGQGITYTATVTAGATGTVTFLDNGSQVGTATLSGSQATSAVITPSVGTHPIVARYNGDANNSASSSAQLLVVVNAANTTTSLTAPANNGSSVVGQGVTFSATVATQAPGSGSPTGTVQFLDNTTVVAGKDLSSGVATITVSNLTAGAHSFSAKFVGSTNFATSSSSAISFSMKVGTSVSTPTVSGTNRKVGDMLTMAAIVTPTSGSGVPTGTITFMDGAASIGSANVNGSGVASLNISTLSAGTHTISAVYNGDATYLASTSGNVTSFDIAGIVPVIKVTANVNPAVYGQSLVYTVTVGPGATGQVDFLGDNGFPVNFPSITLVGGQASFAPPQPVSVGTHVVAVAYYGDTNFRNSISPDLSVVVNKATTTTAVRAVVTDSLTLTATVIANAPGFGAPTGSVDFLAGTTKIGTAFLDSSSGIATATLTATATGNVTAVYGGDDGFGGSTSLPVSVSAIATSLALTTSLNPATVGDSITFTATVKSISGTGIPSGSVDFYDTSTLLGTGTLSGGKATYSTSTLTAGSHTIFAKYNGGGGFDTSQATIGQFLTQGAKTSSMTVSANPPSPVYGQGVTLSAILSTTAPPNTPDPTGTVTFRGATGQLGTGTVLGGFASLNLDSLSLGTYSITADYAGDTTWGAMRATTSFVVSQASTSTSLSLTLNSTGQAVLTATVKVLAPGAGSPTGGVQFVDTTNNIVLATQTLAGGTATAVLDGTAASHPIVAVYPGDTNFSGSTSASQLQLVNTAANITSSFAPDEAVSAYHVTGLTSDVAATVFPLSTTMGGASVKITDSTGISRLAPLYGVFQSAGQINFVMPPDTALGPALVTVLAPGGGSMTAVANITRTSTGIFTANMNGKGVAAGQFVHVHADNSQTFENIAVFNTAQNQYVPNPVSMGPDGEQVYLILYGTGLRHRLSDSSVTATVNGVNVPLKTAAQGVYPALDQMNLQLPRSLAGAGTVDVILTVEGQAANTVQVAIQ